MRAAGCVLLLTGCATIVQPIDYSRPPPPDWPSLRVIEQKIGPDELARFCPRSYAAYGSRAASCARLDLSRGVCLIYTTSERPDLLEHERAHCRGYDHAGETTMRDAWQAHKAAPLLENSAQR